MQRIRTAALVYAIVGLFGGVTYRELTKHVNDVDSQLNIVHTHFLTLGLMMMLIVLALDAALDISRSKEFGVFFLTYNVGLVISGGMMFFRGLMTIFEGAELPWLSWVAGAGHLLLGVGIVALLMSLTKPIRRLETSRTAR